MNKELLFRFRLRILFVFVLLAALTSFTFLSKPISVQGAPSDENTATTIDDERELIELAKVEEVLKERPLPLIPEPNVHTPLGVITDKHGRFIIKGYLDPDYYYDNYGNYMWVYVNDPLIFKNVVRAYFKGTYFSVWKNWHDPNNRECLNCGSGVQTFSSYKSRFYVKNYVENVYGNSWDYLHIKYFIQADLNGYVRKGYRKVYLSETAYEAELWSEADYDKQSNSWALYGFPDMQNGGANYIIGKSISVSVGLSYYTPFPDLSYRWFGHPYVIWLESRFRHQFALHGAWG